MTMVKDLPVDDRPRERLMAYGPGILSNAELLAILLGSGSKEKSAMQLAQDILSQHRESGVLAQRRPPYWLQRWSLVKDWG